MIRLEPLNAASPLCAAVEAINREAFPPEEYMPVTEQLESGLELFALTADGAAVGFLAISAWERSAYLFFLAIRDDCRSKGYGAQALALFRERYSHCQCTVDLEPLDPTADNAEQRIRRRRFYLNNGFAPSGYALAYRGMDFELLCAEPPLDTAAFSCQAEHLQIEGFSPQLLRISAD